MKANKKAAKRTAAEELDEKFEKGEDVSEYIDWETATKRLSLDIPTWALKEIDQEASRRGMAKQALVKHWIVDKLDELRVKKAAG